MSDGAGTELLQVLIPYFASLIGYDEYQIKEAEIPVNVNVHEPSLRGVDTTSDGRISHNGCTVGIIEVQSRRASGSTQKQLLVGCLGHIAKPENVMLLGFGLYKHYSAIIMGLKGNRHDFCYCPYTKLCLSYCHILNIFEKYQLLCKI